MYRRALPLNIALRAAGPEAARPQAPAVARWRRARQAGAGRDWTPPVVMAILVVLLNMLISSNVLDAIGIEYGAPGGNPLAKLHPTSYLAIAALGVLLMEGGRPVRKAEQLILARGPIMLYLTSIALCVVYTIVAQGPSGLALYIETYIPAGVVALILSYATDRARLFLGYAMLGVLVLNVLVGLIETATQTHLVPVYLGAYRIMRDAVGEFRAVGLFDHPLTAAIMTMIGLFMLVAAGFKPVVQHILMLLLFVGLLAWGGRTALAVSAAGFAVWGLVTLIRRGFEHRLTLSDVVFSLIGATLIPTVVIVLLTATSLGERIVARLYWDDSAEVRAVQWLIFGLMNSRDILFGVDFDRLQQLTYHLGLQFPFTDIENFWLLMFLNLGALGYPIWLAGFLSFLAWLWRHCAQPSRLMIVATLAVATSSNSLGRKSNILTIMVPAALCATTIYERRRIAEAALEPDLPKPAVAAGPPPSSAVTGRPKPNRLRRPVRPAEAAPDVGRA